MKGYDPLEYVRGYYKVPAWKGARVIYKGKPGDITGASGPHVAVKLDGEKISRPYHPKDKDLVYLDPGSEIK